MCAKERRVNGGDCFLVSQSDKFGEIPRLGLVPDSDGLPRRVRASTRYLETGIGAIFSSLLK